VAQWRLEPARGERAGLVYSRLQMACWCSCGFLAVGDKRRSEVHQDAEASQSAHITVKGGWRRKNLYGVTAGWDHASPKSDAPIQRGRRLLWFFHDCTPGQSRANSNGQRYRKMPSWSTWMEKAPGDAGRKRKCRLGMVKPSGLKQPCTQKPRVTWFPPLPTAWVPRSAPRGAPPKEWTSTPPPSAYQKGSCEHSRAPARPWRAR
jgi:hypothetical protein